MKLTKSILVMTALFAVTAGAFAEDNAGAENAFDRTFSSVTPYVGLKATQSLGMGSVWSDGLTEDSIRTEGNFGGGAGMFGHVRFGSGKVSYMNQLEVNFIFNQGIGNDFANLLNPSTEGTYLSCVTMEVPVLFGLDIDVGDIVTLMPFAGPYMSVPLSGTLVQNGSSTKVSCAGVSFGGTAGFGGVVKLGPGAFYFDARYNYDFTDTSMKVNGIDTELFKGASIQGSAGYVVRL